MKKQKINFNVSEQDLVPLPHSEEIERKVIAYALHVPEVIMEANKFLKFEGLFYAEFHATIWSTIINFVNTNLQVTPENVADHFRVLGEKHIHSYVLSMIPLHEWFLSPTKFKAYCLKLNEYAISRTIHRLGYHLNQGGINPNKDALELLGDASDGLDKIYQHISSLQEKSKDDAIQNIYKNMVESQSSPNGLLGLPSSLNGINERIKGYRKNNLLIIAASTGEGKTTLAIQEAVYLAEQNIPVGYISLEMSTEELTITSASDKLKIRTEDILSGKITLSEQTRLSEYMNKFKALPIEISEKPGLKVSEIKAIARMWVKERKIQALFVDHIHLAYDDVDSVPEQRYTNIANKLKELAKELNIPVIALAQLSRREKTDKSRRHAISDIKYAGGIEQAADAVLLIYRPALHGFDKDTNGNPVTESFGVIIVGKLRLLPKRDILVEFNGTSFSDPPEVYKPNAGIKPNASIKPKAGIKKARPAHVPIANPFDPNAGKTLETPEF